MSKSNVESTGKGHRIRDEGHDEARSLPSDEATPVESNRVEFAMIKDQAAMGHRKREEKDKPIN